MPQKCDIQTGEVVLCCRSLNIMRQRRKNKNDKEYSFRLVDVLGYITL